MLKVKFIEAVNQATSYILENHLGVIVQVNEVLENQKIIDSEGVSVILGFNGDYDGQFICTMSEEVAKKLVGQMMGGVVVSEFNDLAVSAIQELGNWIGGKSSTELSKFDVFIDVTPPVVNQGTSIYHMTHSVVAIPFQSKVGEFFIHISIAE